MFGPPSDVPRDIFYNGTAAFAPLSFAVSERCNRHVCTAAAQATPWAGLWPWLRVLGARHAAQHGMYMHRAL